MKPRLLDPFSGAGGAARGFQRAGFHVTGVDRKPQPNYAGDVFVQGDALEYLEAHGHEYDAVAGGPPCQWATAYRRKGHGVGEGYLNLIPQMRAICERLGVPYIIENVEQARAHLRNPVRLCGSAFDLDVQRHRMFESNIPLVGTACDHTVWTPRFPPATNRTNLRKTVEVGVWRIPLATQQAAMGIDWMTLLELSQAIPPAYTEYLGGQLMAHVLGQQLMNEEAA